MTFTAYVVMNGQWFVKNPGLSLTHDLSQSTIYWTHEEAARACTHVGDRVVQITITVEERP